MAPETLYLLWYDTETGSSDEWNINYTPMEIFKTEEERDQRIKYLKSLDPEEFGPYTFRLEDKKIMTTELMEAIPTEERLICLSQVKWMWIDQS